VFVLLFYVYDRSDGLEAAIKIMTKQLLVREKKIEAARRERLLLDRLDHPGITRLLFTFQDATALYMALEYCPNGELYDQLRKRGVFSEEDARCVRGGAQGASVSLPVRFSFFFSLV
jgi:3-phosphoinositide dependent protein kinase-1